MRLTFARRVAAFGHGDSSDSAVEAPPKAAAGSSPLASVVARWYSAPPTR
ncbi:MAG: hypothetical protein ACLP9C_04955 [Acidimicrobiales bacterium]